MLLHIFGVVTGLGPPPLKAFAIEAHDRRGTAHHDELVEISAYHKER